MLSIPSMTRFMQDASFFAPIISVITRPGQCRDLEAWLRLYHLHTHGVQYPIVSMKAERVRIMIHLGNTKEQIEHLVLRIMEWAQKKSDQSPITPQRTVVPRESCANASYSGPTFFRRAKALLSQLDLLNPNANGKEWFMCPILYLEVDCLVFGTALNCQESSYFEDTMWLYYFRLYFKCVTSRV